MKRISFTIFNQKSFLTRSVLAISLLSMLSSCSWITSRRSLFGDTSEDKKDEVTGSSVSKAQYDDLLKRYEALMREKKINNVQSPNDANQLANQLENQAVDPSQIVDALNKVPEGAVLAETVDVFDKAQGSNQTAESSSALNSTTPIIQGKQVIDSSMMEDQITKIRKAAVLVGENKFDNALTIIKELEKSPIRQIVVRSKYLLGEILFRQGEYDLSMQIYEEVINKNAFSGLVIKTLGRLIVCAEKLKLNAKKEKYYSILHDFFERA